MRKAKKNVKPGRFHLLWFWILYLLPSFSHAEPYPLSLSQAIERFMAENLDVKNYSLSLESSKISFDSAWASFYMPTFSLGSSSNYNYSYGSIPYSTARTSSPEPVSRGYPSSTVTLSLGSYTLFNFFKDRSNYDQSRLNYELALVNYRQNIRSAKFRLIYSYYSAKTAQDKYDAAQRSVSIAEAITELIDSRKKLGKATDDEQNSASVDLNTAKVELFEKKKVTEQALIALNSTLNITPDTEFKLTTSPVFVPVRLDENEFYEIYKRESPTVKSTELSLLSSEYSIANAEKSRLPLPTLSFSGIRISYSSGFAGGTNPDYTTGATTSGLLEVSASLSLEIPIYGPNGFFNSRLVQSARVGRDQLSISQKQTMINGESGIRQKIAGLRQLESQVKTQRESLTRNSKLLDSIFKKSTSSSTDRLQLRDALNQARQSEFDYLDTILNHITAKNELSEFIGIDRLPGDQL